MPLSRATRIGEFSTTSLSGTQQSSARPRGQMPGSSQGIALTAGLIDTQLASENDPAFARNRWDAMDRVLGMTTFVKVVDNGGFAAAGRALNMSASAVTLHVQAIEERLGVRLLNRTTRHVSMTEAGHAYYDSCTRILADIDNAEQAAQAAVQAARDIAPQRRPDDPGADRPGAC
jgi:molybdenum-dependent DNA-binding transcriptional regulator ModE